MTEGENQDLLSRRKFLKRTGWLALGSTVIFKAGCSLIPTMIPATPTTSDNPEDDAHAWIQMNTNGRLRFFVGKAEMGQGILTGLSQIIANELNLNLEEIDPVFPHTNQIPPIKMTVGSETIANLYPHLRAASAHLKDSMKAKLANTLACSPKELEEAHAGFLHRLSRIYYGYGEIVATQTTIDVLDTPPTLKPITDKSLIGQRIHHIDTPLKVNGAAKYSHDIDVPGMLYGAVAKPPVFEAQLQSVNSYDAKTAPGVIAVVEKIDDAFVGIVARTDAEAKAALKRLKILWHIPKYWQQKDIDEILDINRLKSNGIKPDTVLDFEDIQHVSSKTDKKLMLQFSTPFGTHAAMETHAGVADVRADSAQVWVGSQDAYFHQKIASKITGLNKNKINVHPTFIGGGFGGKVLVSAAVEAIHLSHAIRRPVKVVWSREDNFQNGYFRTPSKHTIEAGLSKKGMVNYWRNELSSGAVIFNSQAIPKTVHALILKFTNDAGATRGAVIPYDFPNKKVDQWDLILPVPTGAWRGLSSSSNVFAIESTIDELALLANTDPLIFRQKHLGKSQSRLKDVLDKAATLSAWGARLPHGKGRGIACGIYRGTSYVAVVAEVSIDKNNQSIKVDKLYCAHDCGLIINPNSVESMIEGNLVWGIGMALKEELYVKQGRMDVTNFDRFILPRMADIPPIEIALLEDKNNPPSGAGEPALMPTAAAIANAVFDASGTRPTRLPIKFSDL